jgi:hypothetical protein
MIVELIGPPGAGKSTTAAAMGPWIVASDRRFMPHDEYTALDRWAGEAAIMKRSWLGRWWQLAPVVAMHPRLAFDLLRLTALHGRPFLRRLRKAQRALAHFHFAEQLEAAFPDRVIVLHDGFVQCLWSLVIESKSLHGVDLLERLVAEYYGSLDPVLVVLEIDDESATRRVFDRVSKGRFNRDSSPATRARFPEWLAFHRAIVGLLPKGLVVLPIDANADGETVARRAWAAIQEGTRRDSARVELRVEVDYGALDPIACRS